MKFEKLQAGMRLFDVRRATGMQASFAGHKYSTWPVEILELNQEKRMALVSWNGNPARWTPERDVTKYRENRPTQ